jgi:hypothetical protein
MKTIFKLVAVLAVFILFNCTKASAQGCVAIRSTGGLCNMDEHPDSNSTGGLWLFNSNSRYYRSYKHFVGSEEQKQRIAH